MKYLSILVERSKESENLQLFFWTIHSIFYPTYPDEADEVRGQVQGSRDSEAG